MSTRQSFGSSRVFGLSLLAAVTGSGQFGFQNALNTVDYYNSTYSDEFVLYSSSYYAGSIFGFIAFAIAGQFMDVRQGIRIGTFLLEITSIIFLFIPNDKRIPIIALRFCFGVSSGFFIGFQTILIDDISLKIYRPTILALSGLVVPAFFLLGIWLASIRALHDKLLAMPAVPTAIMIITSFKIREPSGKLLMKGLDAEARLNHQFYHGTGGTNEALEEADNRMHFDRSALNLDLSCGPTIRATIIAVLINVAAALTEPPLPILYRTDALRKTQFLAVATVSPMVSVFTQTAMLFFMNSLEKRLLTTVSMAGLALCHVFFAILNYLPSNHSSHNAVMFTLVVLYAAMYSVGLGIVSWSIATEITFCSAACFVQGISHACRAFITVLVVLIKQSNLAESLYFAIPTVLFLFTCTIILPIIMPNTVNRNPKEILQQLGKEIQLRKTPERVDEIRQNLHRLWTLPHAENS